MITPVDILQYDAWSMVDDTVNGWPFVVRWRMPVFVGKDASPYIHKLTVVWAYADENSGEVPDEEVSDAMAVFEERLCQAWEQDGTAILVAVLTYDGARQWVFYTKNWQECGERIAAMPQEEEPYPIEMATEEDPEWSYLRDEILANIDWLQDQGECEKEVLMSKAAPGKDEI